MTDKAQLDKFKEAAREAECETDEKAFEEALKKVAKSPPESNAVDKGDKSDKYQK